jgi:phosphonatase-like hydrolase
MDIDLIVLDMAGTTVRDDDAVHACLGDALASVGVRAPRDQINAVMGTAKPAAIQTLIAQFRGHAAATPAVVEAVHDDFIRRMQWHYESHPDVRECDGASDLMVWCRARGIRVALDTGFNRRIADAVLKRLRWQGSALLDATVASDEVERGRPHPDMIVRAMQLTGVTDARRVMKVGDTPADVQQGQAAGCGAVVAVTSGSHTAAELWPFKPTHLVDQLLALRAVIAPAEASVA